MKMILRIREQNDALRRGKAYLADIAYQLRTPLTLVNLILSFLENNMDEKERRSPLREMEGLPVTHDENIALQAERIITIAGGRQPKYYP